MKGKLKLDMHYEKYARKRESTTLSLNRKIRVRENPYSDTPYTVMLLS